MPVLHDHAMRLLDASAGLEFSQMDSYHWSELAELVIDA